MVQASHLGDTIALWGHTTTQHNNSKNLCQRTCDLVPTCISDSKRARTWRSNTSNLSSGVRFAMLVMRFLPNISTRSPGTQSKLEISVMRLLYKSRKIKCGKLPGGQPVTRVSTHIIR